MLESVFTVFTKIVESFAPKLMDHLTSRFRRPKIGLERAPENIFQLLTPGTSIERMREVLGAPHRVMDGQYSYTFSDALVQLRSKDRKSITSLLVALPRITKKAIFVIHPTEYVLGKTTVHAVLDEDIEIHQDNSTKHWGIFIKRYYGYPGLYHHYTYGVLEAPCLQAPRFEWDHTNNRLASAAWEVPINWASVSITEEDGDFFDFWAFA